MDNLRNSERSLAVMDVLARQADLHRARSNRPGEGLVAANRSRDASRAEERLVAYAAECLAQGSHKLREGAGFTPEVQRRFAEVGRMLDNHVDEEGGADMRRGLLQRAQEFAPFSPHYHGHDETDDNDAIADRLNDRGAQIRLSRVLLDRELGLKTSLPDAPGGVDHDFTAAEARRFTDAFGHLQQVLHEHVRTRQPIVAGQVRELVNWNRAGDAGRAARALDTELQAHGPDATLKRFEREYHARQTLERRAAREDDGLMDDAGVSRSGTKRNAEAAGLAGDGAGPTASRPATQARVELLRRLRNAGRCD